MLDQKDKELKNKNWGFQSEYNETALTYFPLKNAI